MLVRDVFFIFVVVGNVEVESRIAFGRYEARGTE